MTIRAPFKESRQRDLLCVKGGMVDYCVIGEIDANALRAFQSSHRSPPSRCRTDLKLILAARYCRREGKNE